MGETACTGRQQELLDGFNYQSPTAYMREISIE